MTDRDTALQWLVQQARDHEGEGPFALHAPEVTKVKVVECLASGEVVFDDDLAWDLAMGAVTQWRDPSFPEFWCLDAYERVNLLKIAVELSVNCESRVTPWLALAAHHFSHHVDVGLGESGLPGLLETLRTHSPRQSVFSTADEVLASLDLTIATASPDRRVNTRMLSVAFVCSWLHYPGASPAQPATGSQFLSMIDWIDRNSKMVIAERNAPDALKLKAYEAACNAKYISIFQALRQGTLPPSDVVSRYEDEVACILTPSFSDQSFEDHLKEIGSNFSSGLASITANWLLDNDSPLASKKYVGWAFDEFPQLTEANPVSAELAIVRAFASARLGLVKEAASELETYSNRLDPGKYWTAGRLWCETEGTRERGLNYLRRAVALPEELGFSDARSRMRLLLAEREVAFGDPERAVALVESMLDSDKGWISAQATVILGEAQIALAKASPEEEKFRLDKAYEVLNRLNQKSIVDTPDRIEPRARAAVGEIHLRKGQFHSARSVFLVVMRQLEGPFPVSWGTGHPDHFNYLTPDDAPDKYPRRPWPRRWLHVAELSLASELSADVEPQDAFVQLQRYRTITHSGTIAELAGFTPEAASAPGRQEKQEDLHIEAIQLKAREHNLRTDPQAVQESFRERSTDEPDLANSQDDEDLAAQESRILEGLEKVRGTSKEVSEDVTEIDEEAVETRGYLSRPNGLRRPELSEIKRHLALEDAAVVELVRVDGTPWGLPVMWHAFAVTADVGVTHVELPAAKIDHELAQLRRDRTRLGEDTLGKLSDLIFANLPKQVFAYSNLYVAADGDAWAIPFRSLLRRRWWFVPWKLTNESTYSNWLVPAWVKRFLDSLAIRMDRGGCPTLSPPVTCSGCFSALASDKTMKTRLWWWGHPGEPVRESSARGWQHPWL